LHDVICRGIVRRKISWEDSDRNDFLKRLEIPWVKPKPVTCFDPMDMISAAPLRG
jgi:hypothetical protein